MPPFEPLRYHPGNPDPLVISRSELQHLGLQHGRIFVLPVVHGRIEFAWMVRTTLARMHVRGVAVELPHALEPTLRKAVARLPLLSIVRYRFVEHSRPLYFPVEPGDALVEGIRTAIENQLELAFVDADVEDHPSIRERIPDPLAAERIGMATYLDHLLTLVDTHVRLGEDDVREQAMAIGALRLARLVEGPVALICGVHHARHVVARMTSMVSSAPQVEPLRRLRVAVATTFHMQEDTSREILAEMGFLNAAYERSRPCMHASGETSSIHDVASEAVADASDGQRPLARVLELFRSDGPRPSAGNMLSIAPDHGDIDPTPPPLAADVPSGRLALFAGLCAHARAPHQHRTGESIQPSTILALLRYACRYALTEGRLAPDLYQLVVAARGFADDSYAHEVWELATHYPWQTNKPELTPLEITVRELYGRVRTLRFRPKLMQRRRKLLRIVRPRPRERRRGEWAERFDGSGMCSHPPEDIAIEQYADHLRTRTQNILRATNTRVLPFTTSTYDGIDVRETLRNWHESKLYVRLEQAGRGKPGAVVVVFDDEALVHEDARAPKYPWIMTWQGEHKDEGDMALYATNPFDQVIGPGIGRALYGGFLINRPPGRMFAVWEDPYYHQARGKAELLLLAALDHTKDPIVVYVAPKPPRPWYRQLAARMGRKLVHVPLGQLSPVTLKKIRVFHVLSGRDVRSSAKDYIF